MSRKLAQRTCAEKSDPTMCTEKENLLRELERNLLKHTCSENLRKETCRVNLRKELCFAHHMFCFCRRVFLRPILGQRCRDPSYFRLQRAQYLTTLSPHEYRIHFVCNFRPFVFLRKTARSPTARSAGPSLPALSTTVASLCTAAARSAPKSAPQPKALVRLAARGDFPSDQPKCCETLLAYLPHAEKTSVGKTSRPPTLQWPNKQVKPATHFLNLKHSWAVA